VTPIVKHPLVEETELFYRLLRVFDVLPQRGQFLPNVFSERR
jgi:hypothetical protein